MSRALAFADTFFDRNIAGHRSPYALIKSVPGPLLGIPFRTTETRAVNHWPDLDRLELCDSIAICIDGRSTDSQTSEWSGAALLSFRFTARQRYKAHKAQGGSRISARQLRSLDIWPSVWAM